MAVKKPHDFGMASNPLVPPQWDSKTAWAIKALYEGKATEHQQSLVVKWLELACGMNDLEFRISVRGEDGDRLSAFQSGKRFVGLQLRKLRDMPAAILEAASKLENKTP